MFTCLIIYCLLRIRITCRWETISFTHTSALQTQRNQIKINNNAVGAQVYWCTDECVLKTSYDTYVIRTHNIKHLPFFKRAKINCPDWWQKKPNGGEMFVSHWSVWKEILFLLSVSFIVIKWKVTVNEILVLCKQKRERKDGFVHR